MIYNNPSLFYFKYHKTMKITIIRIYYGGVDLVKYRFMFRLYLIKLMKLAERII